MKRFASIRFDRVLAPVEREATARTLSSAGVAVTSWSDAAARTYAFARLGTDADVRGVALLAPARVDEPPLVVLRVRPQSPARLGAVAGALAGAGGLGTVAEVRREAESLVVEVRPSAPLGPVVALIDLELGDGNRRIEPLLPLDDGTLAAFAAEILHDSELGATRILETHLEPVLARAGAGA